MKKTRNIKYVLNQLKALVTAPELPDLSEEMTDNNKCCPKCGSDTISVSGIIEKVDYVTGDIFLTARCVTCEEPGLVHYSMVKCINEPTLDIKQTSLMQEVVCLD